MTVISDAVPGSLALFSRKDIQTPQVLHVLFTVDDTVVQGWSSRCQTQLKHVASSDNYIHTLSPYVCV